MTDQTELVPKRRFKGFLNSHAWEQRKLGELGSVAMNKRIFKEQTSTAGEVPFYKIGTFGGDPDAFISRNLFEEYKAKYPYPEVGDILISASGSIGRTVEYMGEDEYFQDSNIVWLKHDGGLDNSFLKQFYSIVKWQGLEGSTIKRLYNKNILNTNISVPSLAEQKKIGAFFKNLDNLITLHQRKLEKTKALKAAYLSEMFPAEGESEPKRRFAGFTGAWEQRELDSIYKKIRNAFVGTATPYYADRGNFYLQSNNVKDGQINRTTEIFINDEFYEKQKDKWLHTGDLVMVQSGHVGHTAVIEEELDGTAAHALIMFQEYKEQVDPYFLNFQFQTREAKRKLENKTTGNTIKHILASEMKKFEVSIPQIEEQYQIGTFFKNLDHLITLHQRKLKKLQNLKKAYLNEMFV